MHDGLRIRAIIKEQHSLRRVFAILFFPYFYIIIALGSLSPPSFLIYFSSSLLTVEPNAHGAPPYLVCSSTAAMIAATDGSHTRRVMNLIGHLCNIGVGEGDKTNDKDSWNGSQCPCCLSTFATNTSFGVSFPALQQ